MWDLVGNPEDRFSHNEAQIPFFQNASLFDRAFFHLLHQDKMLILVVFSCVGNGQESHGILPFLSYNGACDLHLEQTRKAVIIIQTKNMKLGNTQ